MNQPMRNTDDLMETARSLRELFLAAREVQASISDNYDLGFDAAEAFESGVIRAAIYVAGADGPLNDAERSLIAFMTASDMTAHHANIIRRQMIEDPSTHVETMIKVLEGAVYVNAMAHDRTDPNGYDATADAVVQLVTELGNVVIAADADLDPLELRCLSQVTGRLRQQAVRMEEAHREKRLKPAEPVVDTPPVTVATEQAVSALSRQERELPREDALVRLRKLTGLSGVKLEVETLANLGKVFSLRKQKGLPVPDMSFHLVFSGNPGTGKTTVARIIAEAYGQLGLLSKGHVIEVDRSGLVANFVGQTATKTQDVVQRALGGVLFIDEAYALAGRGDNDFGAEAIEMLLKAMEDHREDFVVIVAGYDTEMGAFLQSNPGLRSRFARTIAFPDYSPDEMVEIFLKLADDATYRVDEEGLTRLTERLQRKWEGRGADFANARDVRSVFEAAISAQANRLSRMATMSEEDLTSLNADDIASVL